MAAKPDTRTLADITPAANAALERRTARTRLRALAPILVAAIGALCLRDSAVGGRALTSLEVALAAGAAIAAIGLFMPGLGRRTSALEIAMIWLSAGYLAARAYDPRSWVTLESPTVPVMQHLDHTAVALALLIVAYAVAVPNTLRRAAVILVPVAAAPLVVALIRLAGAPDRLNAVVGSIVATDALVIPLAAMSVALYAVYRFGAYEQRIAAAGAAGRYQLLHQLGAGGMGEVWLARHHLLGRAVALKLIRARHLTSRRLLPETMRSFEREAQTISALRSAHTVELYDFGVTADDSFYYVMEYLPGVDLERFVERHGSVEAERAVYLLRQVCDGLAEAHAAGLVHRDIKPANLMLCRIATEYDFVKILDFGLAISLRSAGRGPLTGDRFVGTPSYAAPELLRKDARITPAVDIYALGCVGYWLLTGATVFDAPDPVAMLEQHVTATPVAPSVRTATWIPSELESVILRCLDKDPTERLPDASALRHALDRCVGDRPWDAERARAWWDLNEVRRRALEPLPAAAGLP